MEYDLEVITPADAPVTLAEAKLHLRVDQTTEDDYIDALIELARDQVEELYLWQSTTPREYRVTLDGVDDEILLPMAPVTAVTLGEALIDDVWVEMADTEYSLDWAPTGRVLVTVPAGATRLRFEYDAGPATAATHVKQACLLMIGHWYEERQAVSIRAGAVAIEVPMGVKALLLGRRGW